MAYTGHLAYKATGELTYRHPIREQDLEVCMNSQADWRADGFKITDDPEEQAKFENLYQIWLDQNQKIKDLFDSHGNDLNAIQAGERHTGESCIGIYRKDTNACIGYTLSFVDNDTLIHRGVSLLPSERDKGYYEDTRTVGMKLTFQTWNYNKILSQVPTTVNEAYPSTKTGEHISVTRIDPITYNHIEITREQFTNWLALDAQEAVRNEHYSFELNWSES